MLFGSQHQVSTLQALRVVRATNRAFFEATSGTTRNTLGPTLSGLAPIKIGLRMGLAAPVFTKGSTMPSVLQVTTKDISNLAAGQLQSLLNRLMHLEGLQNSIPLSSTQGTDAARITVADGGQDASIEWSGGVPHTNFFLRRHTVYQVKAESMPRSKCRDEMLMAPFSGKKVKKAKKPRRSDKGKQGGPSPTLKPLIASCLDREGGYVIFCNQPAEGDRLADRVSGMREGLRLAGRKDWKSAAVDFFDGNRIRDWVVLLILARAARAAHQTSGQREPAINVEATTISADLPV